MSTFANDASAAITPLLTQYNIASATVTPSTGAPFTVMAPVPPAPPAVGFDWGWNVGGLWSGNCSLQDTMNIQQFLADAATLGGCQYVRCFDTSNCVQAPVNFGIAPKLAAAGVKVILTYNIQNAPVRCMVPTQAQVSEWFNGLPSSSASGVYAVEILNEFDSPSYCAETTPDNIAMLFKTATPILIAKGYKVILSNAVNSFGWYNNSTIYNTINALANKSSIYIGRHGYAATASVALGDQQKVFAFAQQLGVGYLCTEAGLKDGTPPELQKFWAGLKAMGGIHCGFIFYTYSDSAEFNSNPFNAQGVQNLANFNAIKQGLGV